MKTYTMLIICFSIAISVSCRRPPQYKLRFIDDIPKETINRFGDRIYNEGHNIIVKPSGETLFVTIIEGKLMEIGYSQQDEKQFPADSLHVMLQNNGGGGGTNRQSYCNDQENICLDGCPWIVTKRDIHGNAIGWGLEPTCLERCETVYDNCMSRPQSGFGGSIGVIRL
ncbi:MAG: hypothetical protein ABIO55_04040 [Ginsengibacter sp.]